ncbi:MAG: hypothetical protein C0391_04440 [Anaerolinea sp.]|nr:hypothetical protein [Anaerolinea sp.]
MAQKSGAQISKKAFIQSFIILLIIMILAGVLTLVVPTGNYTRVAMEGREVIDPASFTLQPKLDYPIWRWFIAPFEVLGGPDGLTIIVIIIFLLMVGAAFAVLDGSGILRAVIANIVARFGGRKYLLLAIISLFFMLLGAFFGIFEEVLPLVPIMIALSIYLGWDTLVGLGMSILAVNMGFSAAVTNPFTIGVAQKLAGLPLFSGSGLRVFFFAVIYVIFIWFLITYARKVERKPDSSPVYQEDQEYKLRHPQFDLQQELSADTKLKASLAWFGVFAALILSVLVAAPFVSAITDYSLPIVALLFLFGGLGAGFLSGKPARVVWKAALDGIMGIAPGILLIMMAASVKYIVVQGGILDTILHSAAGVLAGASAYGSSLIIYVLALVIEFFIGSGSAKAFLLMPILLPLGDLAGVTRQVVVTAYCFGDGFSNLIYPTNPVLLIALGLTVVTYSKWLRWSMKLWLFVVPVTLLFLALAVAIKFGPF